MYAYDVWWRRTVRTLVGTLWIWSLVLSFAVWMSVRMLCAYCESEWDSRKKGMLLWATLVVATDACLGMLLMIFYAHCIRLQLWAQYLIISVVSNSYCSVPIYCIHLRLCSSCVLHWAQFATLYFIHAVRRLVALLSVFRHSLSENILLHITGLNWKYDDTLENIRFQSFS